MLITKHLNKIAVLTSVLLIANPAFADEKSKYKKYDKEKIEKKLSRHGGKKATQAALDTEISDRVAADQVLQNNINTISLTPGPQGATGAAGVAGTQGIQGEAGITGADGAQGIQGIQGIQGEIGLTGAAGKDGEQGIQGVQGEVGSIGPRGIQGAPGQDGAQGIQGDQGGAGNDGVAGAKGDKGDQGIAGTDGVNGAAGVNGTSCSAVQGDGSATISCEDGSMASVYDGSSTPSIRKTQRVIGTAGTALRILNNYVPDRVLTFTKLSNSSALRITYKDVFVTYAGSGCSWDVHINGAACPSHAVGFVQYKNGNTRIDTRTNVGYCSLVPAGTHELKIFVRRLAGSACYTGYNPPYSSSFMIEVEEVM